MGPWVGGIVDLGCGFIYAHVFFNLHGLVDPKLCLSHINLNPIPIDAGLRWPPVLSAARLGSAYFLNSSETWLSREASSQFRAGANSSTPQNGAFA